MMNGRRNDAGPNVQAKQTTQACNAACISSWIVHVFPSAHVPSILRLCLRACNPPPEPQRTDCYRPGAAVIAGS